MANKALDAKHEKLIRGLLRHQDNRKCINCGHLGPNYVCVTFATFVCTPCSGVHRELNHRIKSVSMASFTPAEVKALQDGGNSVAAFTYFGKFTDNSSRPDSNNMSKLRAFMSEVYEQKRFYVSPEQVSPPPDQRPPANEASRSAATAASPPVQPISSILGEGVRVEVGGGTPAAGAAAPPPPEPAASLIDLMDDTPEKKTETAVTALSDALGGGADPGWASSFGDAGGAQALPSGGGADPFGASAGGGGAGGDQWASFGGGAGAAAAAPAADGGGGWATFGDDAFGGTAAAGAGGGGGAQAAPPAGSDGWSSFGADTGGAGSGAAATTLGGGGGGGAGAAGRIELDADFFSESLPAQPPAGMGPGSGMYPGQQPQHRGAYPQGGMYPVQGGMPPQPGMYASQGYHPQPHSQPGGYGRMTGMMPGMMPGMGMPPQQQQQQMPGMPQPHMVPQGQAAGFGYGQTSYGGAPGMPGGMQGGPYGHPGMPQGGMPGAGGGAGAGGGQPEAPQEPDAFADLAPVLKTSLPASAYQRSPSFGQHDGAQLVGGGGGAGGPAGGGGVYSRQSSMNGRDLHPPEAPHMISATTPTYKPMPTSTGPASWPSTQQTSQTMPAPGGMPPQGGGMYSTAGGMPGVQQGGGMMGGMGGPPGMMMSPQGGMQPQQQGGGGLYGAPPAPVQPAAASYTGGNPFA